MRTLALAVICALSLSALPAQASCTAGSAKLPGYCCSERGKTTMDDNQVNIIACVCETMANCSANTGGLIWKAMSNKNDITCPTGQVLTGISSGVATCGTASSANISCPSGQAMTKIVNGVPTCTASAATPNPNCNAMTTTHLNACIHYTADQWGNLHPSGMTGGYGLPIAGPGGSATTSWSCYETSPFYDPTQAAAYVHYSGTAVCAGSAWQCNVSYSFPMYNQHTNWQWPAPSAYYNGPC